MKKNLICLVASLVFVYSCQVNDGNDGKDGINGSNGMVEVVEEPIGENCAAGGVKIIAGLDVNGNGKIDSAEVNSIKYICEKGYDKEVRIDFDWPFFGALPSTVLSGELNDAKTTLKDFDISNYIGVKYAVFSAFMYTADESVKCIVELYDKTNNKPIEGSQVNTNSLTEAYSATSVNFLANMPKDKIDLGVRVRTEKEGVEVVLRKPILMLFRD